jgi:hypothetical protein
MSNITFHPNTDSQKQCDPPLTNPTFERTTVPIISYTRQMRRGTRNKSCTQPNTPYLHWDENRNKYCCSSDLQEVDIALDKIEYSIRRQVENSCSEQLYRKYTPYIQDLIASYMILYENKHRPLVSPDELPELLQVKRNELTELSTYHQGHHEPCSENPDDLGEDDIALMENLRLAEEQGPNPNGSRFFDRMGGYVNNRKNSKKSKKQRKNRNLRRSLKQ